MKRFERFVIVWEESMYFNGLYKASSATEVKPDFIGRVDRIVPEGLFKTEEAASEMINFLPNGIYSIKRVFRVVESTVTRAGRL